MEQEQIPCAKEPHQAPYVVTRKQIEEQLRIGIQAVLTCDTGAAASVLGMSVAFVKRQVKLRRLQGFYIGNRLRISLQDLKDFQQQLKDKRPEMLGILSRRDNNASKFKRVYPPRQHAA